jgi:Transcriptional regulators
MYINPNDIFQSILSGSVTETLKRPFYQVIARESIYITPEQFAILACLHRQDMVTQKTLCLMTNKDRPNVTRLLDRLEHKQLVQRIEHAYDKRIKLIRITSRGISLHDEINCLLNDMLTNAIQNIDERQFIIFQNVLLSLLKNLGMVV